MQIYDHLKYNNKEYKIITVPVEARNWTTIIDRVNESEVEKMLLKKYTESKNGGWYQLNDIDKVALVVKAYFQYIFTSRLVS